jgi:nicotinate (nicotinamide) nucleotide adenylyltransferase
LTRTGLLGGSFNPAHRGHRALSRHALRMLDLDEIWWLVSPGNPLKEARGMAPLPLRYRSAVRAARGLPIRVTAIEREFGTPYTAETLIALRRRFAEHQFVWLMGADNLAQFHRWRDWRGIGRTVPIAVIGRPDMMRTPGRLAPWAGCGASSGPQARRAAGRSGECRHSCCCERRPTRPPPRPCAPPTPTGTRRCPERSTPRRCAMA